VALARSVQRGIAPAAKVKRLVAVTSAHSRTTDRALAVGALCADRAAIIDLRSAPGFSTVRPQGVHSRR